MDLQTIENYQERFRDMPLGVWSTSPSTPQDQIIRFFDDRRGVCQIAKRLGGGIIHFEWQVYEACCLRIRRIDPRTGLPKDVNDWLFLRYEFDYDGDDIVMRLIEFGRLKDFPEPLYFHGRAKKGAEELVEAEPGRRPETLSEQLHGRGLIAFFLTGMIVGLGLYIAEQAQANIDPLVYVFAGIGLFAYLYYLMSRPPRPKPAPEEEYVREQE